MQSRKLDNTIGPSIESLLFISLPQWDFTYCKHVFFFCLWLYLLQTNQLPMEDCGWSDSLFTMQVFNPTPSCNSVLILFFWPRCIFLHRYCILCLLHIVYTVHVHKPGCCSEPVNNKMCLLQFLSKQALLSNAKANLNTSQHVETTRDGFRCTERDLAPVIFYLLMQNTPSNIKKIPIWCSLQTINNSEWEERC